jgi:formiminotetrahydrofolate cyclodeaminase
MLVEMTLKEFNEVLGSNAPAPGGGSVAALSGSLGGELISMVCNLSFGKEALANFEDELKAAQAKEADVAESLTKRVDLDTEAFNQVMAAFKMPKETDEEIAARKQAIQDGYKEAIDSPLSTARECMEVLRCALPLKGKINTNAMSDFGVGALMAYAGLEGAVMNVRINLPAVTDEAYVTTIEAEVAALLIEGAQIKDNIYKYVYENLG